MLAPNHGRQQPYMTEIRYFLELSYQGSNYCGWQRQPNAMSVQQTLEESLSKLLREPCFVTGCGRTDTGVHASHYVAHFQSNSERVTDVDFLYHLNCILPADIAVSAVYPCELHARFDARYREYRYIISRHKDPFLQSYSWLITTPLDVQAMIEASQVMLLHSDFTSLARLHSDNKTNICKIAKVDWEVNEKTITFVIGADRFLRGMIRATMGTLVDVGRGKLTALDFEGVLMARDRGKASSAAPAQGLFLSKIEY